MLKQSNLTYYASFSDQDTMFYSSNFCCPAGTQLQPTYIHIHSMVFKNAHMGCLSDLSINFFSSWIAHTSKVCSSQPVHSVSFSEFFVQFHSELFFFEFHYKICCYFGKKWVNIKSNLISFVHFQFLNMFFLFMK